ncbi:hypothetical protein BpHYR1_000358 [Brachionus plicatilis]|uniref:Uncharacterized protein n=1 Tax=Brachionus plicatilis TaxID=10195 RepID=A0A3M7QB07_BRAPC|nr:hypothetical protein BpHYR1_000358 [Brachionus plicatilis]
MFLSKIGVKTFFIFPYKYKSGLRLDLRLLLNNFQSRPHNKTRTEIIAKEIQDYELSKLLLNFLIFFRHSHSDKPGINFERRFEGDPERKYTRDIRGNNIKLKRCYKRRIRENNVVERKIINTEEELNNANKRGGEKYESRFNHFILFYAIWICNSQRNELHRSSQITLDYLFQHRVKS